MTLLLTFGVPLLTLPALGPLPEGPCSHGASRLSGFLEGMSQASGAQRAVVPVWGMCPGCSTQPPRLSSPLPWIQRGAVGRVHRALWKARSPAPDAPLSLTWRVGARWCVCLCVGPQALGSVWVKPCSKCVSLSLSMRLGCPRAGRVGMWELAGALSTAPWLLSCLSDGAGSMLPPAGQAGAGRV